MIDDIAHWLEENKVIWIVTFGVLFFLSIDFWNWNSDSVIAGFLPIWVFRLILLQFLLAFGIGLFVKYHWRD